MNLVEYIIRFREQGAAKAIDNATRQVDKLDRSVAQTNNTLGSFQSILASVAVIGVGRRIVEITSGFERYNAVLTNTFQSQQIATAAMQMINELAATTPFNIDELNKAYVKLANQGIVLAAEGLTKLGDVAGFTGKGFDQLVEALLDARVGEFIRLREFGIRAERMGEDVAFTFRGVRTQVEFTAEAVEDYILSLGELEGVTGVMAAISQTLGGRLSNLEDSAIVLAAQIGESLRPVIIAVVDALKGLIETVSSISNALDGTLFAVDGVAAALATFIGIIAAVTTAVKVASLAQAVWNALLLANPVTLIVAAVAALISAIVVLVQNTETGRAAFAAWFTGLKITLGVIKNVALTVFGLFSQALATIVNRIVNIGHTFRMFKERIIEFIKNPIDTIVETISNFISALAKIPETFRRVFTQIKNFVSGAANEISQAYEQGAQEFRDEQAERNREIAPFDLEGARVAAGAAGTGATASTTGGTPTMGATVSSTAPRQFNINIENLVREFTVSMVNNVEAGAEQVKETMQQALLEAVADVQIAR